MDKTRLEELKQLVTDGLLIDWSQGLDCDWYKHIEDEDESDLLTIINEAISQADKESLTTDLSGNSGQLEGKTRTEMRRKLTERKYRIEQLERLNVAMSAELRYLRDKLAQFDSTDDSTRATQGSTGVTNFERWKQGLTIDEFAEVQSQSGQCGICPLYPPTKKCWDNTQSCFNRIKEWGEQYA